MSEIVLRLRLFLSSYAPLFAILAIRLEASVARWGCTALAVLGLLNVVSVRRQMARLEPSPFTVRHVADRGAEVAGYLATYLFPFITVPEPTWKDAVAYAILLAVVASVYVQSDMLAINPVFYLFRLKVVSIETECGFTGFLVIRTTPTAGDTVQAAKLSPHVLIQSTRRKQARG